MAKSASHEEIGAKYPIVYVQWIDSAGCDGWVLEQYYDDPKPFICYCVSVGFLLNETEETITVAATLSHTSHQYNADSPITIPRVAIKGLWYVSGL